MTGVQTCALPIFIDEIDAIGCKRDKAGNTSENDQTINAMLEQMDGFTGRDGVFVIAATNRADQLDDALVRPGRFDRQVAVNPPSSWLVRQELFRHYMGKLHTDETVDLAALSRQTPGFTGADIAAVCNEAGIVAAMTGKSAVDMASIEEAIDKKVFRGSRSKREQYEKDKIRVAWHEAGHALVTWILNQPITRASIQPTTSGVGGAVIGADPDTQRLQPVMAVFFVECLHCGGVLHKGHHHIPIGRYVLLLDEDVVSVENAGVHHAVPFDVQQEGLLIWKEFCRDWEIALNIFRGEDWLPGGNAANHGNVDDLAPRKPKLVV